jgi:hypothetical protein
MPLVAPRGLALILARGPRGSSRKLLAELALRALRAQHNDPERLAPLARALKHTAVSVGAAT